MNESRIRTRLITWKIYVSRATNYLTLINAGMLLFLFLSRLKENGAISFELDKYFIPIIIIGFLSLVFAGWVDIKVIKGLSAEHNIVLQYNLPLKNITDKVNEIHDELFRKKLEGGEK